ITVVTAVNISIVKKSNVSGNVVNGAYILYTINVTNYGPDGATGLIITDRLDSRLIYINSSSPRSTYYVPGTGVWNIGALANGESIVLDILVRLNGTGNIVNIASIFGVNENNTGSNSSVPGNETNISVVGGVNISVVKSSNVSGSVVNGAYILYTINVTNFGPDGATGLVVIDSLDSRLVYVNSTTPRGTSYVVSTGIWNIGALANGESIVLDILVRLNGTGNIVNVASIFGVNENNTGSNSSVPDNKTNITVVTLGEINIDIYVPPSHIGDHTTATIKVTDLNGKPLANLVIEVVIDGIVRVRSIFITDANGLIKVPFTVTKPVTNVEATFSGNDLYYPKYANEKFKSLSDVKIHTNLELANPTFNGNYITLKAALTDAKGNPLSGKLIKFYFNGGYIGSRFTSVNGLAILTFFHDNSRLAGLYKVSAVFNGDSAYSSFNVAKTFHYAENGTSNTGYHGAGASMKHTGVPLIGFILILLFGIILSRRKEEDEEE
ncbi:MAG: DUF11 domain-containing protein, partial [Methanobrevibacter sp.]|nr:DUF11 domain-containing protein [Methanobrevibacter sp.]